MIKPKVSIITVTFNAEKVIERTLKSIEEQNYDNIECIIVDGLSTDGTMDIVKKYPNVVTKYISEKDNGIYYAMNKGISLSTGDYLWFINAGDTIYNKNILSYFFSKDTFLRDIYYGNTLIVDMQGKILGERRLKPKDDLCWKDFHWGMLVCHQSVIVKKKVAPLYDTKYRICADYKWVLESFYRARYTIGTRHKVASFLEGGFSRKNMFKSNVERFKIMISYYGLFPSIWYNFLMIFRFAFTSLKLGRI
ncbi:MAG: glycosyltransferase [Bacteroidales bacterium]|jgi:glycosyltransferase involved in cell wall biosynthesis|nr:glycosyltransferase [Bacteroidales bacterium]